MRNNDSKEITRAVNYLNELYRQKDAINALGREINAQKLQSDINSMSPEESEKYLSEVLAGPIYDNGTKIIEPLKAVDPDKAIDTEKIEFISMANTKSNQFLKKTLLYNSIIVVISLLILILSSKGIKKILTPGILILIASIPGVLFFGFFGGLREKFITPMMGQYSSGKIYDNIISEIVNPITEYLRNIYLIAGLVGVGLVFLFIVLRILTRNTEAKPAEELPAAS